MVDILWIARHGNRQDYVDPDWMRTAERPYDPGLSDDGIVQARQLAERMRCEPLAAVVSSPFLRTLETAYHIASAVGCPMFIEPGLSEWLHSEWFPSTPETLPVEELIRRFPLVDPSYEQKSKATYGETEREAMRRSAEAVHAVARDLDGAVAIVGHSVSVVGSAAGLVPEAEIPECGMCCLFKLIRRAEAWEMALCADLSHLRPGDEEQLDRTAPGERSPRKHAG